MHQLSGKTWRTLGFIGALAGALATARCGHGDGASDTNSARKASVTPVQADVTAFSGEAAGLYDYAGHWVQAKDLEAEARAALNTKLQELGVVPTEVPEFLRLNVKLEKLAGCYSSSASSFAYCQGGFSFDVTITATAGPDTIDQARMTVPFAGLEPQAFKRRLQWTVNALVDQLVENGLLPAMGVETPYY